MRALARLPDLPNIILDAVGGGEDLEPCRREAEQFGVAGRITFHGRLPPEAIDAHSAANAGGVSRLPASGPIMKGMPMPTPGLG